MISKESLESVKSIGRRVYLQVPEGLKTKVQEIAGNLEKEGLEVFVSCEPCFGACDIRDWEAKALGCDVILHVGHTDFGVKSKVPVVYEPYRIEYNIVPVLEKIEALFKEAEKDKTWAEHPGRQLLQKGEQSTARTLSYYILVSLYAGLSILSVYYSCRNQNKHTQHVIISF